MIISRTPFRVSFLGGGTDLPAFYLEEEGAVLSTSINKYVYITVNDRFDESYRLSYSKTEICKNLSQVEHKIFQKVLTRYQPEIYANNGSRGLEILSMADIPSGTGLGSSSSFTVGLLHAVKSHIGKFQSAEELADEASRMEIEELNEPIGKQDQYAAAYGGLQYIRFLPDGQVSVDPVICSKATLESFESSMLVFYTGITRSASSVLTEQRNNTGNKRDTLREMKNLAFRLKQYLENGESIQKIGDLLHQGWLMKKTLAGGISDQQIDQWYERAREAGAYGGKILGAGGGGFLMVLCAPESRKSVIGALSELRQIELRFEKFGSKIIFVG